MLVYNRIRILGSVASGKTTLAKQLSIMLKIPYYELDNVVWKRTINGDVRHTEEERNAIMKFIIQQEQWIVEGVHNEEWVNESFEKADVIILLNIHLLIRDVRIIKRFTRQMLGKETSHYKPTIKMFFKMFKWNRQFEKEYQTIIRQLNQYNHKLIILSNNQQLENFFNLNLHHLSKKVE
ncbi:DNA topology modulation protein FlaR [Bacillus suaedaesalsae]|uniref:DNA topology modulation protein FlaR n=1 Tax=Bacillus suaedaesalsae TaxID=2810349 RepID=A0ABS2DGF9_9BACI|nr:DNA topology modulation protein FlaR [Bacillus suaedaesalsae]